MILTKTQLKTLIKEEAARIRKEMQLENEKSSRKSQLQKRKEQIMFEVKSIYGDDSNMVLDEGFLGFGKTPEQKTQEEADYKVAVLNHPVAKQWVKFGISKGLAPEAADQQVIAIHKKFGTALRNDAGKIIGFKNVPKLEWDEAKKQLVPGKQSFSAPGMSLAEKA